MAVVSILLLDLILAVKLSMKVKPLNEIKIKSTILFQHVCHSAVIVFMTSVAEDPSNQCLRARGLDIQILKSLDSSRNKCRTFHEKFVE